MSFTTTFTLGQRAMHLSAPRVAPLQVRKLLPHAKPIKDSEKARRKSQAGIWGIKYGARNARPASNSPPRSRNAATVFLQTMNECLEFAKQECIPAGRYPNVECSTGLYKPKRGAWPWTKDGARTRIYSAKNLFGGDSRFAVKFDPSEYVSKWEKLGYTGQPQRFGSGVASGLMEVTSESLPVDMEGVEYTSAVPPASSPPTREVTSESLPADMEGVEYTSAVPPASAPPTREAKMGDSGPLLHHQAPASTPLTIEREMRDPVSAPLFPQQPPTSAPLTVEREMRDPISVPLLISRSTVSGADAGGCWRRRGMETASPISRSTVSGADAGGCRMRRGPESASLHHQPPVSSPLAIEREMRDPVSAPATPPTLAPASPPPVAGEIGPLSIPTPATTSPTTPASPPPTSSGITPPGRPTISPSSPELDKIPAPFRPAIQEVLTVDPSVHQVDVLQSSSATISSTTELANHPPGTKVTPPAYPSITFTTKSQRSDDTQYYSFIREEHPQVWEMAIGTFFQEGHDPLKTFGGAMDETARQILGLQWILDYKRADDKAWEARYGGSAPSKPYYAREDLPRTQQPVYDEVVKRIRALKYTFTSVVKHWAKTRQDVFLPMLRKAGWCELWWNKATEDLIRWIVEEAPVEISETCKKLMQRRVPRMWTYVVAKMQQEAQSAKV